MLLHIPHAISKEYTWMLDTKEPCAFGLIGGSCAAQADPKVYNCSNCIFAKEHAERRRKQYEGIYPTYTKELLRMPELSTGMLLLSKGSVTLSRGWYLVQRTERRDSGESVAHVSMAKRGWDEAWVGLSGDLTIRATYNPDISVLFWDQDRIALHLADVMAIITEYPDYTPWESLRIWRDPIPPLEMTEDEIRKTMMQFGFLQPEQDFVIKRGDDNEQ